MGGGGSTLLPATAKVSAALEVEPSTHRSTKHKPALVTLGNTVYCLFLGSDDKLWFTSKSSTSSSWHTCAPFTDAQTTGAPALGVSNSNLHAVISRSPNQDLVHYQYDLVANAWGKRAFLGQQAGGSNLSPASLVEFKGTLYCAYNAKDGNRLHIQTWDETRGWIDPTRLDDHWTYGEPSLFVTNGKLRMLYISANEERDMLGLVYDEPARKWKIDVRPSEWSRFGLTATSVDPLGLAWVIFQANNDTGQFGVAQFSANSWASAHWTSFTSVHTPALVVINNELLTVWSSRNGCILMWATSPAAAFFAPDRWMSGLPRTTPLSSLTIPGTHNSCITNSFPWVGCQTVPVSEQVNMGVRAFDFRVENVNGENMLTHDGWQAEFRSHLKLDDVLQKLYSWLDSHGQEALLIHVKEERSSGTMAPELKKAIDSHARYWRLDDTPPTLDNCRGKIQLLRRFGKDAKWSRSTPFGIDVTRGWNYNDADFNLSSPGFAVTVQDRCILDNIDIKWKYIEAMLNKARHQLDPNHWFINFTSASGFQSPYTIAVLGWQPLQIDTRPHNTAGPHVPGINERLQTFFRSAHSRARYGMVMMDYPESQPGLILTMLTTNF